jgi:hypothetical protein
MSEIEFQFELSIITKQSFCYKKISVIIGFPLQINVEIKHSL